MKNKPIPYGRQNITQTDIDAVVESLKSDFLTQGPKIVEFENAFAKYVGAKYAVAVSNGTAALHLSALALEVCNNDKVITTPITFAASANCIRYCGGDIVFCDIEASSYLIDIEKIRELLQTSPRGTYKGVIPVDFAGRAVNMEALREICDDYGLWIIEDACHAPGGYFMTKNGKKSYCGSGEYADLTVFSFHPVKHIACGEGGMITTNNLDLYNKLLKLRTHGIVKDPKDFTNPIKLAGGEAMYPAWYMEMQDLGYNYRLTDFQAALGVSQLSRADDGIYRRREIARHYFAAFKNSPFILHQSGIIEGHAYHLYIIEVQNRYGLYNFLKGLQIFAQIHYFPCHLMPYYLEMGTKEGDCPTAENYYKHCISLPMYPTLSRIEQDFVIDSIKSFFDE